MRDEASMVIVSVDDNDMNLLLVESYLRELNAQFFNFTKASDAAQFVATQRCDMVITDYVMPEMDGVALARAVKAIDTEIPVIMITSGSTEERSQVAALESGVNDFIIKPISKAILLNRVKNFLKLRRAIVRLQNSESYLQSEIAKATRTLKERLNDLQIAQEITHLGSWTWDIMSGALSWSDETYRIFGLEPGSVEATYEKFLQYVHPDDRKKVENATDHAVYHHSVYDLRHRIIVDARVKHVHERGTVYYNEADEPVYMVGTVYDVTEVTEAYRALQEKELETLQVLSRTADYKDEETSNHIKRVSEYVVLMARHLGLDAAEQNLLRYAAPLHDLGKVGIPDRILLKPGKLDDEEMTIMREHARIGADILENTQSPYLQAGQIIARTHHEKYDGSGYPEGLRGDAIPLYGRIVAVADVFDALSSKRPYKESWTFQEAMRYMIENSGKHFDPILIKIFSERSDEVYAIYTRFQE